ncbi:MAG: hypothetical protein DI629_08750 [Mesorhizobium amorphae]|nr:MAG: hypothetical protein DI629_08750 [Mesorhizobium amorphae]
MDEGNPALVDLARNGTAERDIAPDGEQELVRGQTLTEQVYLRLRRGLLLGTWKPGDKITARKLSRSLGVSLTPAREAMLRLADEGAIDVSEKRTFSIPKLDRARYAEITHVRMLLEPEATAMAAAHAGTGLLEHLRALNDRLGAHIEAEEFDLALSADSEFHLSIYDAAGSPVLRRMIDTLWMQVGPTRTRLSRDYQRSRAGFGNHLRIIAALQAHDGEGAAACMRDDLRGGAQAVMSELR